MQSKILIALTTAVSIAALSASAIAEKPEWAGKGKPTAEQKEAHNETIKAKEKLEDDLQDYKDNDEIKALKEKKEKIEKKDKKEKKLKLEKAEKLSGLEKQQARKSEQVQNELDKGSEQGQEARSENAKKWWKFWGE